MGPGKKLCLASIPSLNLSNIVWFPNKDGVTTKILMSYFLIKGHCGSSNWGIALLMEEDIIPDIVGMAEESDNLAIRG